MPRGVGSVVKTQHVSQMKMMVGNHVQVTISREANGALGVTIERNTQDHYSSVEMTHSEAMWLADALKALAGQWDKASGFLNVEEG